MIRQVGFLFLFALLCCIESSDATTTQVIDPFTTIGGRVQLEIYYGVNYPGPSPYSWFAPYDGPFAQVEKSQITSALVFSGYRDFAIGFMSNSNNYYDLTPEMRVTTSGDDGPRVQISIPHGLSGTYYVQYDGNDSGTGAEFFANGAVTAKSDFTLNGGVGVTIEVNQDPPFISPTDRITNRVYYTLSVKDVNGERADAELDTTLMSTTYRQYAFLFEEFDTITSGTFDWTQVTALQVRVSTYPFSDGFDPENPPDLFVCDPSSDEYVTNFRKLNVFSLTISGNVGRNCGCDATFDAYSGETITLLNVDGDEIGTTVTSATGAYTFSSLAAGTYTVCWTDAETPLCGDSCVDVDLGSDNIDPVVNFYSLINILTVPGDTTTECDNTDPATTGSATVSSCSGASTVTYSDVSFDTDGCVTSIERTWSETEQGISGVQTITIEDTTNPDFDTVPTDETVECGLSEQEDFDSWKATFTASDNCDTSVSVTVTPDDANTVSTCSASTPVIFIATDDCGNTNTQTADFTIEDTTAPSFDTVPTAATIPCGPTEADDFSAWLGTAAATDVCTSATITNDSTGAPTVYCGAGSTVTVTFTASDACGNESYATSTFTIEDTVDPFFTTDPAGDVYECDGTASTTAAFNAWVADNAGAVADDACGSATLSNDNPPIPNFCGGTAVIVVTATDECGNTASASASYTINDSVGPTISGVANGSFECTGVDTDLTDDFDSWVSDNAGASATDDCGGGTLSNDGPSAPTNYCGASSSVTMTITATDNCGRTSTATATYTAVDTTGPSFTTLPAGDTYECDGTASTTAAFNAWVADNAGAVADDPCGTVTLSNDNPSIPNFCGGTAVIVVTATDECGNTSTESASYTINDSVAPSITGATSTTFQCTGSDTDLTDDFDSWVADNAGATGTDDCGFSGLSNDGPTAPTTYCGGSNSVTMTITATDNCGRTSTATATYTAADTTAPTFTTAPSNGNNECDGTTTAFDTWVSANANAVASDTCSTATLSNDNPTAPTPCGGTSVIVVTATDDCGNSVSGSATYTINDTTNPTITGEMDHTYTCIGDSTDLATVFSDWVADNAGATASDSCAGGTLSNDNPSAPSSYCTGSNSVTMTITATDSCGRTSTATATFTAVDTTAPTFDVVPVATTVTCGADEATDFSDWLDTAAATDSCSGAATITNDSTGPPTADCYTDGTVTVTFTATDACGNTATDTSSFTVEDTAAPTFSTSPIAFTYECTGSATTTTAFNDWVADNAGAEGNDNCGDTTITNDNPSIPSFCGGTGTMLVTITDDCGNSHSESVSYTITDNTPPTITGATSTTFQCTGSDTDLTDDFDSWVSDNAGATGSDVCGFSGLSNDGPTAPTTYCGGSNSVTMTITATDNCGRTSTATATYTAVDTTAPTFTTAPSNGNNECDGTTTAFDTWVSANANAVASDTCSTATLSNDNPTAPTPCGGTSVIVVTATDDCGNSVSGSATYTINDTTNPTITGEMDHTYTCIGDSADLATVFSDWVADNAGATASDSCAGGTLSNDSPSAPSSYCTGSNSVTMTITATDSCGRTSTATATFTAVDTTAPAFDVVPVATTVTCGADEATDFSDWLDTAAATDSCSGAATITNDSTGPPTADCYTDGTVTVTFTATDACGNTATDTSSFTVEDTAAPTFSTSPIAFTYECTGSATTTTAFNDWVADNAGAEGNDNCGDTTITNDNPSIPSFCGGTGAMLVTITDDCGNSHSESVSYTITDNTPPTITGATSTTFQCTGSDTDLTDDFDSWVSDNAGATGSDVCGFSGLSNDGPTAPTTYCGGSNSVTMTITATDNCGRTSTATATYTAVDTTAPTFTTAPSNGNNECDGTTTAFDTWVSANANAVASDTCSTATLSNDNPTAPTPCGGTSVIVVTATDDCGNSVSGSATYTINDTTNPTITGEMDHTYTCIGDSADLATVFSDWVADNAGATASDSCAGGTLSNDSPSAPSSYCTGSNSVTMTITATDSCGRTSTATATFTAVDTTAPTFDVVPVATTVTCGADEATDFSDWLDTAAATDSCSGAATITNDSTGPPTADCYTDGTVTVTFTATDVCGNTATDTSSFTVEDTAAPTFSTSPIAFTYECTGSATTTTAFNDWVADNAGAEGNDNCGDTTITNDNPSIPSFCGGTGTMLVTITDDCGNSHSESVSYTITDNTPPTITGATSTTFQCTGSDTDLTDDFDSWVSDNAGATGSDVCGFSGLSNDGPTAPTTYCGGSNSVTMTITATDNCGRTSTATATYTAVDTTAPTFTTAPSNGNNECDGTTTAFDTWVSANANAVASDTCSTATLSNDNPTAPTPCGGTSVIVVTATDDCGNSVSGSATYTINDTTNPTITGEMDHTYTCIGDSTDLATVFSDWVADNAGATASDSCAGGTLSNDSPSAPSSYCTGSNSVTMTITATDSCGRTSTATATFTAVDTTAPTFDVVPVATTVTCGADEATDFSDWLDTAAATDSCSGAATITNDSTGPPTADCYTDGTVTVTFTATDACGNTATDTSSFTVEDTAAPTFSTSPIAFTYECTGSATTTTAFNDWVADNAGAEGNDNCGDTTITNDNPSIPSFCGGTGTMLVTITDDCGNSHSESVSYTITDNTPPTITGATSTTFQCTGSDTDLTDDFDSWVSDNAGATGSDVCGFSGLSNDGPTAPTTYCGGSNSVIMTITATDNCGRTSTATATYTAVDTTAPTFTTAPSNGNNECDGTTTAFDAWVSANANAVASDTCSTATLSNDNPTAPAPCGGTSVIVVTATDDCGNSVSGSATYTINDTTNPSLTGVAGQTFQCTGDDSARLAAFNSWVSANAGGSVTDACGGATISNDSPSAPTGYCGGSNSVIMTVTATDGCGRTSTATATFSAVDTNDPTFTTVPADYTSECSSNTSTEFDDWIANSASAVASDTCDGSLTLTNDNSGPSLSQSCSASRVVTFTGTDTCGNSVSATAQFVVEDTTDPIISTPASDRTVQCNAATNGDAFNLFKDEHGGASGYDACTSTTWDASAGTPPYTGSISCNAEHSVTFTLSDTCGRSSLTTASFFIEDTLGPSITSVATDLQVECHDPTHEDTIQDWLDANGNAAATDCQTSALTWSNDYTATGVCPFDDTITFTVCDECSNCAETTATLNKIPPIIYEPDDISEWAIYHPACIAWSVARVHGDVGTITLEYGIGFANAIDLETGYDLTLGTYEWIVHGMYPAIARVKISYEDITHDPIYSHEFEVRSVQTRLDNSCALVL